MGQYRPGFNDLTGRDKSKVDVEQLERVFREVFDRLYETPISIEQAILEERKKFADLLRENADIIQQMLQANGDAPLNLTSLPGIPAQASQILQDTHANRIALYPAPNFINSAFYETDRKLLYVSSASSGTYVWQYVAGVSVDTHANRWADLTTTDVGVFYVENDRNNIVYYWTGTAWTYFSGIWSRTKAQVIAGLGLTTVDNGLLILQTDELALFKWSGTALTLLATFPFSDTHNGRYATGTVDTTGTAVAWVSGAVFNTNWAGRHMTINGVLYTIASVASTIALTLSSTAGNQLGVAYYAGYFSLDLVPGVQFFETDRQFLYQTANSVGTVTPAGTTINWTSGDIFLPTWVGGTITIAGTDYTVATYVSSVQITVTSTAGTPGAVAYSVRSGKWLWVSGTGFSVQASLPTDLGTYDFGAVWAVTDYYHLLKWTGSTWTFQEGDGSGHVVMGKPDGSAPNGGLWGLCDGSSYNVLNANGTLTNTATQNLTGEVFLKGAAAVAGQQAATRATWEAAAVTDNASAGTPAGTVSQATFTGDAATARDVEDDITTPVSVVQAPYTPSGSINAQTFTGSALGNHQHVLSDANAQLKVFSEANGGLPLRISTVWYMRR